MMQSVCQTMFGQINRNPDAGENFAGPAYLPSSHTRGSTLGSFKSTHQRVIRLKPLHKSLQCPHQVNQVAASVTGVEKTKRARHLSSRSVLHLCQHRLTHVFQQGLPVHAFATLKLFFFSMTLELEAFDGQEGKCAGDEGTDC